MNNPIDCPVFPAPELTAPKPVTAWDRERAAFTALLPQLLSTHHHQFVAIYQGQVVESGEDSVEVATRAYQKMGYVPIYLGWVSEEPRTARIPTPRVIGRAQ